MNDWKTPNGEYRSGLTTTYLKNLKPTKDNVVCKIAEGATPHPESIETPAILVGLGTGMAPIRAFV